MSSTHRRIDMLRPIARLRHESRATAAVEFALILPILIMYYLGMNEVQPGFSIKRKLSLVTRTLGDLVTRSATPSKSDLKDIFGASNSVMRPYDGTGLTQMVVTSVTVTKVGATYVGTTDWSCGWNLKSAPTADDLKTKVPLTPVTVPAGFQNDATQSFILDETQYPYTPNIGYTFTGTVRLSDSAPWAVRNATKVTGPGCPSQS